MSYRLLAVLIEKWQDMDGFAVAHNMPNLQDLELGRVCNFVYWRVVDGITDSAAIDKFRARLWQPPRGVVADPRSPWSPENEQSAFKAAKAMLTGSV